MKQTTEEERLIIIRAAERGDPLRKIREVTKRSISTISEIIRKFKTEGSISKKRRKAPNKKLSATDERYIVKTVKKNPRTTAPELAANLENNLGVAVCAETVRRVLRKNNFHGRTARNKPLLRKTNKRKRLDFAKKYGSKGYEFWKEVLFTDESKFNIFQSDGKITVWRKPGEEYKDRNLKATVKHGGGGVMVWGCMSASGVGRLQFIDSNMDKWMYLDILKRNLQPSVQQLGLGSGWYFYGDNDPKHTAKICKEYLLYNAPHVIDTPPQSPDLNVIEHLWQELEKRVRKRTITNKTQLKVALQEEWGNITANVTQNLVKSMPRRLEQVRANKGGATKY